MGGCASAHGRIQSESVNALGRSIAGWVTCDSPTGRNRRDYLDETITMSSDKPCVYYLAPREAFHHAHHAWVDELVAANIRCKECRSLSWPGTRPRQIYLDGVNKLTVCQSAWLIGAKIVDAELWKVIAKYVGPAEVFDVFLPAKRISNKLREARTFDPTQFTLHREWVGVGRSSGSEQLRLGAIGDSEEQTKYVCRLCGSVKYAIPDRAMYVLSRDWQNRVCCMSSGYLLMVDELVESLKIRQFKGTKLCRVAVLDEEPPNVDKTRARK